MVCKKMEIEIRNKTQAKISMDENKYLKISKPNDIYLIKIVHLIKTIIDLHC